MSKKRKLLEKILTGTKNVSFDDMVTLIEAFGFRLSRINGSHHIFIRSDIPEPIADQSIILSIAGHLQSVKTNQAIAKVIEILNTP